MPLLDARDLQKTYGLRRVLDGVSLSIDEGERIGVVGANGSGKSTLGRILAGSVEPDAGVLALRRGARVAVLDQEPTIDPEATALDAALAGLVEWTEAKRRFDRASEAAAAGSPKGAAELARAATDVERHGGWDLTHRAESILARLAIPDPLAAVGQMSGGERRRVALARALVTEPDLLVLDEPTNHLDVDSIEWLERHLTESFRGAILLVTHDRTLLDAVASRTLEIEAGRAFAYAGGWEAYLEGKAERLAHEEKTEANRQNLLRRELEWLRRSPSARTGKSKSRVDRAKAALAAAPETRAAGVTLATDARRSGKRILEIEGLSIEVGGRTLVRDLDLVIGPGERLAVLGPNGCGKTTFLRTILGELAPAHGTVRRGGTVEVAYLSQGRDSLPPNERVIDVVASDGEAIRVGGHTHDPRSYLERFGIRGAQLRQPVGSLSGGERARVALARLLRHGANLLLLDEPTNDLDVDTLGALEELLVELQGTALVVTHDRWFLDRVATATLAFEEDGRVVRHAGGYTDYRARQALAEDEARAAAAPTPAGSSATRGRKPKRRAALTYAERLELDGLLGKIDAAETRVAEIEAALADPALYQRGSSEVADQTAALETARAEVAALTARWEDLAERQERG